MYPDDETANLNAANTALQRRDTVAAARYLDKAGGTPEAVYARGVLAYLAGRRAEARRLWQAAREAGLGQAEDALGRMSAPGVE